MQRGTDGPTREAIEGLVRRAQEGDVESLAGLYSQFHDKIHRYVYFRTGNRVDAEDITEEVFLRMLESIGLFRWKGHPFSSWLFRVAHNLVVDYFRKNSRQVTAPLEEAADVAGVPSVDVESKLDLELSMQQVYAAMEGLTKLQREVVSLRFAAGLSIQETAQVMGKKENAVKALQHAAVSKLRATLDPPLAEFSEQAGAAVESPRRLSMVRQAQDRPSMIGRKGRGDSGIASQG